MASLELSVRLDPVINDGVVEKCLEGLQASRRADVESIEY